MDTFIGQIQAFGFNFAPRGWAECDGKLLAISQYNTLFSLLGVMYGGDGRTTFGLPDYRSRSAVCVGRGPGLADINEGGKGGVVNQNLSVNQLPSHAHSVKVAVNTAIGDESSPISTLAGSSNGFSEEASANSFLGGVSESSVGGNQTFDIRNPYLGINVCIAIEGVYPSRN